MNTRQLSRKGKLNNNKRKSMRLHKQRGGNIITIKLFDHLDQESEVKIANDATVLQLKQQIAQNNDIANVSDIQLFDNNELKDKNKLSKYGLTDMSELTLVVFDEDEVEEEYDDDDDDDDDDDNDDDDDEY
jgi:hypothetical protein